MGKAVTLQVALGHVMLANTRWNQQGLNLHFDLFLLYTLYDDDDDDDILVGTK